VPAGDVVAKVLDGEGERVGQEEVKALGHTLGVLIPVGMPCTPQIPLGPHEPGSDM
jgi:hypothetical protein